jgi:hypothetical protein
VTSSPWRRAFAQLTGTGQEHPVVSPAREGYTAGRRALAGLFGVRLTERSRREFSSQLPQPSVAEAAETARASSRLAAESIFQAEEAARDSRLEEMFLVQAEQRRTLLEAAGKLEFLDA